MGVIVKICGVREPAAAEAALAAGADLVGFVFFEKSPRWVTPADAHPLSDGLPARIGKVGLFVDPDDQTLDATLGAVDLDMIQLHGDESPARVAAIAQRTGKAVMKAVKVASAADVALAHAYRDAAERILFDAAPPKGADRPGGHGRPFDWSYLRAAPDDRPWMLSGGLDPDNVVAALAATGAPGVDVSSGVESAPGVKSPEKIVRFTAAARAFAHRGSGAL